MRFLHILLFFGLFAAISCIEKLRYVQAIWRHGDRAPKEKPYLADLHDEHKWPRGWGQLTKKGMREMKELGQFLRGLYVVNASFVDGIYNKKEVQIHSSDVDRALESALALLSGMFPPPSVEDRFDSSLAWEPIAIHATRSSKNDPILRPSGYPCERYRHLQTVVSEPTNAKLLEKYKPIVDFVRPHLGIPQGLPINMHRLSKLHGIKPEMIHDLSQPEWVLKKWPEFGDKNTMDLLWDIHRQSYFMNYNGTEEITRLYAGMLLNDLLNRISVFANGNGELEATKMMLLSSHHSTMMGLLAALNIEQPKNVLDDIPPYASCLLFEIYEDANQLFVKLSYRRDRILESMSIKGCEHKCELDKFLSLLERKAIRKGEQELDKLCKMNFPANSAISSRSSTNGFYYQICHFLIPIFLIFILKFKI